jgi:hypothetical protein
MLIDDGGSDSTQPSIPTQDYSALSVRDLEAVLGVKTGAMTAAADNWGHLHDRLAQFLGKADAGVESSFPASVASLKNWKGAAAEEFRKYARSITDLANGMMQVAGQQGDNRAGTFKLLTGDVVDTTTSAQGVMHDLQDKYKIWKHTIYSILTDTLFWSGQGVFSIDPGTPAVRWGKTDYHDPVRFVLTSFQLSPPVGQFAFDYSTNQFSANGPYWVQGTITVNYNISGNRAGVVRSFGGYGDRSVTAMDPATRTAITDTYRASSSTEVNKGLGGVFDQQDRSPYKNQLLTLAQAVGYLYEYRRRDLPKVPEYLPPDGTSGPGSGGPGDGGPGVGGPGVGGPGVGGPGVGGPGVGGGGPDYTPPDMAPSPLTGENGLTGPDAFSGGDPSSPDHTSPELGPGDGYDPSSLDPGGYDPGGYDPGGYDPYSDGGQLAGLGDPGYGGGLFTPGTSSGLGGFDPGVGAGSGLGGGPGGSGGGLGGAGGALGAGGMAADGAGLAGAAGRASMPMGAGAGAGGGKEGKERQRQSWLSEDDDVWGADTDAPGPVL